MVEELFLTWFTSQSVPLRGLSMGPTVVLQSSACNNLTVSFCAPLGVLDVASLCYL
jgi:hypothetical protein